MKRLIAALAFLFGLPAFAQSDADWKPLVEAAKKEGTLVIAGPPARALRSALTDEFVKLHPEINIEYVGGFPHELEPRILQERGAGRFLWDVYINGAPSAMFTLKPRGALDPLLPALVLPEVKDETKWIGGFRPGQGFADKEAPLTFFMFDGTASALVHVNRKAIGKDELKTFKDLLDPKWKGKILVDDPRREGPGIEALAVLVNSQGKEFLHKLMTQELVFTRQPRQIAEWIARGRYPIAIGAGTGPLTDLRKEGVGREVELFFGGEPTANSMTPGWGSIALVNRAPHPNAARVYINFLLSRRGQETFIKVLETRNSRRVDVAPMDPALTLRQGVTYAVPQSEAAAPLRMEIKALAEKMYP
jgi:iron(III) transport system substrate-binding protein